MSAVPKPIYNADQYLALEQGAEYRSQFYFGEICDGGCKPKA